MMAVIDDGWGKFTWSSNFVYINIQLMWQKTQNTKDDKPSKETGPAVDAADDNSIATRNKNTYLSPFPLQKIDKEITFLHSSATEEICSPSLVVENVQGAKEQRITFFSQHTYNTQLLLNLL